MRHAKEGSGQPSRADQGGDDVFLVRKSRLRLRLRRQRRAPDPSPPGPAAPSEEERERRELLVRRVMHRRSLETFLQPILDLKGGGSVGVEALSRFSDLPLRSPDLWFADAASVGLGVELEMLAIRKALEVLPMLPSGLYLSLNASVDTILSDDFRTALGEVPAERVVLELTEHAKVGNYALFREKIRGLRSAGVRLAVDDAGAGYATFRHVLEMQPDVIKLDIGLTRGIDKDPARQALGQALLTFGLDAYHASIVAEGIETAGEFDTLRALGCPLGQGYYLARPGRLHLPANVRRTRAPSSAAGVIRLEIPKRRDPGAEHRPPVEKPGEDYQQLLALAAEIRNLSRRGAELLT